MKLRKIIASALALSQLENPLRIDIATVKTAPSVVDYGKKYAN